MFVQLDKLDLSSLNAQFQNDFQLLLLVIEMWKMRMKKMGKRKKRNEIHEEIGLDFD